jgi:hypothetical protein
MKKPIRTKCALFLMLTIGIIAVSCDNKSDQGLQTTNGLVLNYGNPEVDGCGWVIKVDTVVYSPVNLDTGFKQDSLKVKINYQISNTYFSCDWKTPGYLQIKITSIKKQ